MATLELEKGSNERRKISVFSGKIAADMVSVRDNPDVFDLEEVLSRGADPDDLNFYCFVLDDDSAVNFAHRILEWIYSRSYTRVKIIVLTNEKTEVEKYSPLTSDLIHLILPRSIEESVISKIIENALEFIRNQNDRLELLGKLGHSYQEIQRLTEVGQSLASERNLDTLIGLILDHAREIVAADSGSIYITDRNEEGKPLRLRFKKSSLNLGANEFVLPIDTNSIAGYVAYSGEPLIIDDVYKLTGEEKYRFNNEFDKKHGYYSRSMMVIPMKNHQNDVIGVIQLINRKVHPKQVLTLEGMMGDEVTSFSFRDQELSMAMAGQAAVAIENNQLIQDISNLFEGFVRASVSAIEQRDPTTSGHSFRVAEICVGIATILDGIGDGRYSSVKFSAEQTRELRYAALLHDFGKVGVREHVLVKAKKLYDHELEHVRWRYRFLAKHLENENLKKKVEYLKTHGRSGYPEYEASLDRDLFEKRSRLVKIMETVEIANEPSILESDILHDLLEYSKIRVPLDQGYEIPFLTENEVISLSVKKGSLNEDERMQIMLHVSNTYNFLIQIPWTRDLGGIPDIAFGHHEKLDGSGYPMGLEDHEISLQTRIMTIADIFDALTATDRPYKKEVSYETALDILHAEAKENRIDSDLLKIFQEAEIYKMIKNSGR